MGEDEDERRRRGRPPDDHEGDDAELEAMARGDAPGAEHARWIAPIALSLFLTQRWAGFLFPDERLPEARELMLVAGVVFLWDAKGKPLSEIQLSRITHVPRASLGRKLARLAADGWVTRNDRVYHFNFAKFDRLPGLAGHRQALAAAIKGAARKL
jgi:hypothetical protein